MRTFFSMMVLAAMFGCNSPTESEADKAKPFFDLSGYIKTEETRLTKMARKAKKTTEVNTQREVREVTQPNFGEELAAFSQADINRPAWFDQYEADTTRNQNGQTIKLTYTAMNSSLKTRSMEVNFDTLGAVSNLLVMAKSDNPVASTEQVLTYSPTLGYTIDRTQDMALIPATRVKIKVEFLR